MKNTESFKISEKQLLVLWTCSKSGNGICQDQLGNEYYIDSSIGGFILLGRGDVFQAKCRRLDGTLCVYDIGTIYHKLGKLG